MTTIQTRRRSRRALLAAMGLPLLGLLASHASAAALVIVNPSFETDTGPVLGASGWTITTAGTVGSGGATDWVTTTAGAGASINDPLAAASGNNWLSSNRLALAPDGTSSSDPARIVQLIDISGDSTTIDLGTATVTLDFMFSDSDQNDNGFVNIYFYSDVAGTTSVGSSITTGIIAPTAANGTADAPWASRNLSGAVPALTRSLRIEIVNDRLSGSAGNTHFDDFSGSIIPEPGAALLGSLGMLALLRRRR